MGSKKEPKEASKPRRKLALNKQTVKDLTPREPQAKAVRGGCTKVLKASAACNV